MCKGLLAGVFMVFAILGLSTAGAQTKLAGPASVDALTSSPPFTRRWIARRTTFLPTRSSAWPTLLVAGREVLLLIHPNRWSVTSIRNIVRMCPLASLQHLGA